VKTETILASLAEFDDDALRSVQGRCGELLKQHDTERKDKALIDARAILASAGLSIRDVARKGSGAKSKSTIYRGGHQYQHPTDKSLIWNAKGKKPNWLAALEAEGGRAVEVAA
jgi:hypothetical protein